MSAVDNQKRDDYRYFLPITTRWGDNDVYGHVNQAVYYTYMDTVVNHYLITRGGLDIFSGPVVGMTAETRCCFRRALVYPEPIDGGLRVDRLGRSSVHYAVALFSAGEEIAAASGQFVHVFVDRATRRPVAMPPELRKALAAIENAPMDAALAPPLSHAASARG